MILHLGDFFFFKDLKKNSNEYFKGSMIKSQLLDSFSSNNQTIKALSKLEGPNVCWDAPFFNPFLMEAAD